MIHSIKQRLKRFLIRERLIPVVVKDIELNILQGKIALVTGGNSGIGFAIAKKFIACGAKVIILGSNEQKLQYCAQSLNCEYVRCNMMNVNEIQQAINKLYKIYSIGILVNSAGFHGSDLFGEVQEKTWNQVFDINVKGLYFMCQTVSNHMIEKNIRGHILNVSSASSIKPGWTPYEISKRAVNSITQGMAFNLIKHGIVVNGIAPGPTATPMLGKTGENIDLSWGANPSGRMSTPEEIANLAAFMASSLGDGIVGDTFFMTGGSGTICIDK